MAKDSGTVNIHGKEYKTVAKRVDEFRKEHKLELAIVTDLVSDDGETVVMKASIQNKDGWCIATGYAEEKRNASQINRTSALENCETSAIGRALANLGYGGGEYASADEVANAIGQQEDKSSRIDFGDVQERLDMIDDLDSLRAYYEELKAKGLSAKQMASINRMVNKTKERINGQGQ